MGLEIVIPRSRRSLIGGIEKLTDTLSMVERQGGGCPMTLASNHHNKEKLASLRDTYHGKRCFILGNSPSIKTLDLSLLGNEYTFTVGRGYKLKDVGLSSSTFHVMSDYVGYTEFRDEIDLNFSRYFFIASTIPFHSIAQNIIYFDYYEPTRIGDFQGDLTKPLPACQTVVGFVPSIAYYLGFREIIFLGVDLDFTSTAGHAYAQSIREQRSQQTHSKDNRTIMLDGLRGISRELTKKGLKLVNASPAGVLDCMPRVEFSTLFRG